MRPTALALSLLILAAACLADVDQRGDRADCSASECTNEERGLLADNAARETNAAHQEGGAVVHSPAAVASRQAPAHDSHQQDSSSPLLKVNFWLTLLISALAAALLS